LGKSRRLSCRAAGPREGRTGGDRKRAEGFAGPEALAFAPLAGAATPATAAANEDSSGTWSTVIDGSLGNYTSPATSATPNNGNSVTFPLNLVSKPEGYDITAFDSYCAWGSSGRDDQNYTLQYSTVADPATFTTLTTVANHSPRPTRPPISRVRNQPRNDT